MRIRRLLLSVVLTVSVWSTPAAQIINCPFEDGPAVSQLRALMDVVRRKDLRELRRVLDDAWSRTPEAADARDAALVNLTRLVLQGDGFAELRVCTPRAHMAIGGFADTVTQTADQVVVQVGDDAKASIEMVQTASAARLLNPTPAPPTDDEKGRVLDAYVRRLAEHGAFSGVVAIGHSGATVYAHAFGEANRDTHAPVTLDTPFNLASLNKIMTAVAVLQLVEAHALSLDDFVATILPNASKDPAFTKVQIKHLLSHTSGLDRDPDHVMGPPGQFFYSNLGFRLLGDVVAAKTHMRYEDYLRLKVLGPSGMSNTGRYDMTAMSPWLTFGYTLQSIGDAKSPDAIPAWTMNPYLQTISGGAMGGLYSTAPDLLKFADALLSGRLVKPETLELMKTPKPELGAPGYGFGVMFDRMPGVWGHGGDLPGADAALEFYPGGYVAVVLANMDSVSAPITLMTKSLFNAIGRGGAG